MRYSNLATININDVADAETVDCNKDTNINDISSSKSAQIAAEKIVNKQGWCHDPQREGSLEKHMF